MQYNPEKFQKIIRKSDAECIHDDKLIRRQICPYHNKIEFTWALREVILERLENLS